MNKMTTHELARELLDLEDVPVVHVYNHWDNFDDNPMTYVSTFGLNLLQDDEGNSTEVGLFPEELIYREGFGEEKEG